MNAAHSIPYVPLDRFLEMPDPETGRLEWHAGLVYAMSGGSPTHSGLGASMILVLGGVVDKGCRIFDANADVWVDAAQFYGRADASIVCGAVHTFSVKKGGRTLGEAITNPTLLVEVLSPSTEQRDRHAKFEAYKQLASLREYILVSQDERRVEVRRRDSLGWSVDVAISGQVIVVHGKEVSVDEIYDRVA